MASLSVLVLPRFKPELLAPLQRSARLATFIANTMMEKKLRYDRRTIGNLLSGDRK